MSSNFGRINFVFVVFLLSLPGCKSNEHKSLYNRYSDAKSSLLGGDVNFACGKLNLRYKKSLFDEKLSVKDDLGWKELPFDSASENSLKLNQGSWSFDVPPAKIKAMNAQIEIPILSQKPYSFSEPSDYFETNATVQDVPAELSLDFYNENCTFSSTQDVMVETTFLVEKYVKVQSRVPVPLQCALANSLEHCIETSMPALEVKIRKLWQDYEAEKISREKKVKEVVETIPYKMTNIIHAGELVQRYPMQGT